MRPRQAARRPASSSRLSERPVNVCSVPTGTAWPLVALSTDSVSSEDQRISQVPLAKHTSRSLGEGHIRRRIGPTLCLAPKTRLVTSVRCRHPNGRAMVGEDTIAGLHAELICRFGVDPATVRTVFAPYRICPLGAHVDHQLGQVTAMAIDRGVTLAYAPVPTAEAWMASRDYPGVVHFPFANVPDRQAGDWGNFLRGAVRALQQHYVLNTGIVGVTQGSASEGGLSSSAAVGVGYLLAIEDVNRLIVTPEENILLDQYIENVYLGLRNGVLDQAARRLLRRNQLTLLDCVNFEIRTVASAKGRCRRLRFSSRFPALVKCSCARTTISVWPSAR